jgi:hypothetical protein
MDQTEVMNRAAVIMGEQRIADPGDDTKVARELSAIWDTTRRSLFRSYRWGCLMKRAQLAASATVPLHQFAYQFPIPADFVRLDYIGPFFAGVSLTDYRTSSEALWAMVATATGRAIETSLPAPLDIRYVADIEVVTYWDDGLIDAMACKLATDAVYSITKNRLAIERADRAFALAITSAISTGSIERPPEPIPDHSWGLSRK